MSAHPQPILQLRIDLAGWLNDFALPDRTSGRTYYSRGQVVSLDVTAETNVTTAYARVQGTRNYTCTLTSLPGGGWDGVCSCPVGDVCKHLYAAGTALLNQLAAETLDPFDSGSSSSSADPRQAADEKRLVAQFTSGTGQPPDRKQLGFLRNLLTLHRSLQNSGYLDYQALRALVPVAQRHSVFNTYSNPFHQRWKSPPSSPLELWSHLALLFVESEVPLPAFMAKVTDLTAAKAAISAYQRERELAAWRSRFASLESSFVSFSDSEDSPPTLRTFRLRLTRKKAVWEISSAKSSPTPSTPSSPSVRPTLSFETLNGADLRRLLYSPEASALALEPASASLAVILRAHQGASGRTSLNLNDSGDREFLARLLTHPLARTCITDHDGQPITRDPRRLIWQFRDHPSDPELTLAQLAFADGTPAPTPLVHLPAKPDLYLHGATLFSGLPPPPSNATDDVAAPVSVPRAALALPEAGRFAARARVTLPNDTASRFRTESLRPRLRASLAPRRSDTTKDDDAILIELAAISPDGALRAHYENGIWRRSGPGLPPPSPDAAFLILDFDPTREAVTQFHQLTPSYVAHHPDGARLHVETTSPHFPEIFASWLEGFPPKTLIELSPELAAFAQAPTRAHFAIDLTPNGETGIDWFDVRVTLRAEDTTLTAEEITILHQARGRFVRLAGQGWRRLALDDSSATQEKLARLGINPETAASETNRDPLRFHALQLADEALREVLPEKHWNHVRERAASLRACAMPPIPPGLIADLRPYQNEGFHFLAFLSENNFGGILADDMGLGKTLQTLAWFLWLAQRKTANRSDAAKTVSDPTSPPAESSNSTLSRQKKRPPANRPFRALVICPKSVVVNWQLETARFAPDLATTVFTSALVSQPADSSDSSVRHRPEGATLEPPSGDDAKRPHLLIANYAQLRLHATAFASETWDAVVLDEGQNIKNPVSATAQAARALPTAQRLVLTGTPVENRLLDLWSLFSFAQPGLLGGQSSFKRLYNDKTDPTGARTRLAQRVKHFLLRRTKSQVARDLPPRIEEELVVELEGEQRRLYDAELKQTRALLLGVKNNRDFDNQRFNILQSLLRLRQICCDPRLLQTVPKDSSGPAPSSKAARPDARTRSGLKTAKANAGKSKPALATSESEIAMSPDALPLPGAKLEALLDTLEPLVSEGHKVLVFSQFVRMLDLIRLELNARGIRHLMLTGQTENRQSLVNQFQADPEIPVFLLSLKAAGSGLNLTAASYVVLFDPWWNPAVEAQAIDRTHRIGQTSQVIAYRLIARNTVEEKIRALQREKAALAAAVVQEESLAVVLDLDSLRHILA